MRLTASDIHAYYRPSLCGLRLTLQEHVEGEVARSPYEEVLERLGQEHERRHLQTFSAVADARGGGVDERVAKVQQYVQETAPVIYQAVLRARTVLAGEECEIIGIPDFMVSSKPGFYLLRDSKISRRITDKEHPEILLQLGLYGWLYEQTFGGSPARLEVHSGTGDIIEVGGCASAALKCLEAIVQFKQAAPDTYAPVGWSKCGGCPFHDACWARAERDRDVAMVLGVDQGLATALRAQGVISISDLLTSFDEVSLSALKRPWGKGERRVGTQAKSILMNARALDSGKEILIKPPDITRNANYVMFDLEGLPPQLDEVEKIYLWGVQVFGDRPSDFMAATAGFGNDGDREGWMDFLEKARLIFAEYGEIPFVHWHHYERVKLDAYVDRFGDPDGTAARVKANLLDLLPMTRDSVALPLPSYSLKVVERHVGFERTQDEYGGDWAIAKYIEATEMEDPIMRQEVMADILKYNREDLEATWAVLQWLLSKQV